MHESPKILQCTSSACQDDIIKSHQRGNWRVNVYLVVMTYAQTSNEIRTDF